ncbi:MAG: Smr/MutS family protein [Sphingomonadales bacterium]|jgi:DNA-nicking Smr family endonuclease|nr:Smr/MutS family protein [Sphingomonadales bacterium]MBK9003999.1 Smr/MutS family protein [Sphingomonadales bacterium]MBK9269174.1 Smr/MutS family protein [Sphingomonadales bacterium]MBP6434176.1 Smr/MutS family protein [Sphingorhabdus sp.]
MARRLHPEERSLWNRVVETVKPLHPVKVMLHPQPVEEAPKTKPLDPKAAKPKPKSGAVRAPTNPPKSIDSNLDSHWDRRFHKGAVIPDISIDLHGQGLAGAHARLDHTLEQAIHQRLRVVLLVTGKARAHDRTSGLGRGAIAAVVRDWLAASRHAVHIAAVRQAHPRHGGDGALYIVLKR